jgi:excisionase family DNA binding protein
MDEIMNLKEASEFLKIHEGTVRELAKEGKIPARKIGREWRFSKTALIEWMKGTDKTVKLTDEELATIKTALTLQIQQIDREIREYERQGKKAPAALLEIKQQYENAFEALSFAR